MMAVCIITKSSSDELKHYGILGQKWGVRRFQNADRTLTPEGKERYSYKSSKYTLAGVQDLKKSYDDYQNRPKTHTSRYDQKGRLKRWSRSEKKQDAKATENYRNAMSQLYSAIKAKDPDFQKALGESMALNTKLDALYKKAYDEYELNHPYIDDYHPAHNYAWDKIRKTHPKLEDQAFNADQRLNKHLQNGIKRMCGEEFFNTPIDDTKSSWTYGQQFTDTYNGAIWNYAWQDAHISDGWMPR